MKILIVLISCIFCPPLTTQDGAGVENNIICNIGGAVWPSSYVFDISKLPDRCNIITVGYYFFENDEGVETQMKESDKDIIQTLVAANKPVYIRIVFKGTDDWAIIFNPPDANVFQTKIFGPFVNFLNKFKINGLLIRCEDIYNIAADNVAQKVSDFVGEVKKKVEKFKVGMILAGSNYESFTNNKLFDFAITNKVLDLYIIFWATLNSCDKYTVKTGVCPVTSTDPSVTTIEKVTNAVTSSSMEKSKIYGMVNIQAEIPRYLLSEDAWYLITTYSIYCSSTDKDNSSQWCSDPSRLSYDQGVHTKKFYAGILLESLDTDDYESKCACGPFPVTNTVLDGWSGSPFKTCPKLDQC